jgi:pyridoxamine 5'-phosphate oxidase
VILREANAARKLLRFNADVRTRKWQELTAQPAISLVFYDETEKTQLRIEGEATLHSKDDMAQQAWNTAQPMSRIAYGSTLGPGTEISDPANFSINATNEVHDAGFDNFGTIEVHVHSIEWLYLKVRGNRRAMFDLRANTAQWLVP